MLILISFLINQNTTIDIHVHDTYFVIAQAHFLWVFVFILWILWSLYFLTRKVLYSKSLTWIHVIITLLAVLLLLFLMYFSSNIFSLESRRFLDFSSLNSFNRNYGTMRWMVYSLFALFFGQFLFLINLGVGLVR